MLRRLLLRILINITAFYGMAALYPAVQVGNWQTMLLAGVILALINLLVRPVLLLAALPINLLTLGLFTLFINTWMVMLCDKFVAGFHIPGFGLTFLTALMIALINIILKPLFDKSR